MSLATTYLGMQLRNPIIVSSSKLTDSPEKIRQCYEAGAGAVVLRSLFEEQIISEIQSQFNLDPMYYWYPHVEEYVTTLSKEHGIDDYLRLIQIVKAQNPIPIIASINCVSVAQWTGFSRQIEQAGADALELNISFLPMDEQFSGDEIELRYVEIVKEVRKFTRLPLSVKISPCFSNIFNIVSRISNAGADGVVLFNRFYQPDFDVEKLAAVNQNTLSSPQESLNVMRWITLLSGKYDLDLSASTGIYDSKAVIKQLLAGASTVQLCSTLYKNGVSYIETILQEIKLWMKRKNYSDINEFRGKIKEITELKNELSRIQYMQRDFD
ncbi:MAG: dihydroorotate dehydrogenase-like protein [Bacteroidetes bacterium]|nr:dihydroorotate dehydrogenase-like protein [Bacteroidota bacterium]